MKVVIVGAGKVGSTLAKSLAKEKHDIVVIDKEKETISKVTSMVDCMGVVGNGAIQSVLLEAELDKADFLIACTSSDEINILTCLIARKTSKCRTIARIRNPEYTKQINYIMNELDISTTINPELATANEISRIIRYSSSISSDSFFKGHLNLLKLDVPDNSKLIGLKLFEIPKKFNCNILVCVIERDNEPFVPSGTTVIKKGDRISIASDHQNAIAFFNAMGYPYKQLTSFMIVGGSRIAKYLIGNILHNNSKCKIKVIDIDKKVCEELAELYPEVSVVCADATDKNMLIKEGMNDVDAFITLTGIDEENIILSLFAQQNEKTKVITKINHLNFVDSLKEIEVGSVVNPERIASNLIVSYVRAANNAKESNIEALYRMSNEKVEALGFKIRKDSSITNTAFRDLHLKPNVLIAGIYRGGEVVIPNGNDMLKVGDRVVIISNGHAFKDITDILNK